MTPALTFTLQSNLDSEVIEGYRLMRSLLQKHNFTEEESEKVTYMPDELMSAHMKFRGKVQKLYSDLYRYGFSSHPEELHDDVSEHIQNKLKEINKEISLENNTGFYGDKGIFGQPINEQEEGFEKLQNLIKNDINEKEIPFSDHVIYWDGEKDINESCEGIIKITDVQIEFNEDNSKLKDKCKLFVTLWVGCKSTTVTYEDMDGDGYDDYSVKIYDLQDASYVIDEVNSIIKHYIIRKYPFNVECIKIIF